MISSNKNGHEPEVRDQIKVFTDNSRKSVSVPLLLGGNELELLS